MVLLLLLFDQICLVNLLDDDESTCTHNYELFRAKDQLIYKSNRKLNILSNRKLNILPNRKSIQ